MGRSSPHAHDATHSRATTWRDGPETTSPPPFSLLPLAHLSLSLSPLPWSTHRPVPQASQARRRSADLAALDQIRGDPRASELSLPHRTRPRRSCNQPWQDYTPRPKFAGTGRRVLQPLTGKLQPKIKNASTVYTESCKRSVLLRKATTVYIKCYKL